MDNIGIVSDHVAQVHMALNESRQDLQKSCLTLHEISVSLVLVEPLGLSSTSSSCGPFHPWNVLVASAKGSDVFRIADVAGWELDGLMDHVTFLGVLRRGDSVPLPGTPALAELQAFIGVMILIGADWARPWFPYVLASGASLFGYGVAQSFWRKSDVSAVGRIPEVRRWRCGAVLPRRHAFESVGFRVDSRMGEVHRDGFGRPIGNGRNTCVRTVRDRSKFSRCATSIALESFMERGHG